MQDKNAISSIQLAEYQPTIKIEKENSNGKWVDYGDKNNYPDYLLSLYKESPTNHAVIDKMVQMIIGKGIQSNVANGSEALRSIDLNEQLDKLVFDYYTQGGCYLEVIRAKSGNEVVSVEHLPFENCRLGIADEDSGEVTGIWYSSDWEQYRKAKYEPKPVPLYDPQGSEKRSVLVIFKTTPGSMYYPSPSYEGSINYIEAEIQIGIYHNNQLLNGLFPSFIVNFRNGELEDTEAQNAIVRQIENKVGGSKNAGKFMATFSNPGAETYPLFEAFPLTDADKQYEFLSKECTDKILRGHRITNPILFGIRDGGGLGNNANEMAESKRQIEEDVIFPERRQLLKGLLPLLQSKGIVPEWQIAGEEAETDKELSYDKGQMEMATMWMEQYNAGLLDPKQARSLAVSMLGFDEVAAEELFPDKVQLSDKKKVPELTDDWGDALAKGLSEYGHTIEEMEEDGWELVGVEKAGGHEDEENITLDDLIGRVNLSIADYANPGERSKWGDKGLYKLRYRYSGNISENSRGFCREMVGLARNGFIFRKEDIDEMSDNSAINGKFAMKGQSTYDIFTYKGGALCHHHWERLIFFRKRNNKGEFLPKSPEDAKTAQDMVNDKRVGNTPVVPRKGKEAIPTNDMRNGGFVTRKKRG